jgi:ParB family chromosome partitioning protein
LKETKAEYLPINLLQPFEDHPFKVTDDEEMDQLVWSILTQGLLTPLVVRPLPTGKYEVISGHRRLHACKKAGIDSVPALITNMDRDAAAIALVDSNLHREHILPSEKAFAYKLKMDALSRQGQRTDLTSTQVVSKLRTSELVGEANGDSRETVRRYIRLTNLIPEILQMVDEGRIALTPAVELSYLTKWEQKDLLETMESEDCTPSLSQAMTLKAASQARELNMDRIFDIMTQPKPNQQERIRFDVSDIRKFFPQSYTTAKIQKTIYQLLENYQRTWKRSDRNDR